MSAEFRILVVDDDHWTAQTIVDILKFKGYQAEAAYSGAEALETVTRHQFRCVLTDIRMPELDGVQLFRALKAMDVHLPVVFMTAYATDRVVEQGLEEGALGILTKPLDIDLLLKLFSQLRKERSIVIVDDDRQFCETLAAVLDGLGYAVTTVTQPHSLVSALSAETQIVLLDMKLNSTNGLEVLKEIRTRYPKLPVILVTGYREEMASAIEEALKMNAHTCLYKPLQIEELQSVLAELRRQQMAKLLQPIGRGS